MNIDAVMSGIVKYVDREVFTSLNGWQDVMGRVAVARLLKNPNLKTTLEDNAYVKMLAIIDEQGNVDVNGLYEDIKTAVRSKGKVEISFPFLGKFIFNETDVDKLYHYIKGDIQ